MRSAYTGFALLSAAERKRVAAMGGVAAHRVRSRKAHEWTPAEAQAAGRKGGQLRAARAREARIAAAGMADMPETPRGAVDGHTDDSPL